MDIKKSIGTICYFDIKKSNGGAIFANNLDLYLNNEGTFTSKVYYNDRSLNVSNSIVDASKTKRSLKSKLSFWLVNSGYFELLVFFLKSDLNAIKLVIKLRIKGLTKDNNILLFHDHISFFYYSVFFSMKNKKAVMIMHNDGLISGLVSAGIKNKFKREILSRILNYRVKCSLNRLDRVVFLCENAKSNFEQLFLDIQPKGCITIPNGLKTMQLDNSVVKEAGVINFITVCTLNVRKGIDLLINVIPEINRKYGNRVKFTIVGQGPLLGALNKLAEAHDNLYVIGESNEIPKLLSQADVFFLLSRAEGQPLSILEALRASLPVIATDVGCNSSMVGNHNGILIHPNEDSVISGFEKVIVGWEEFQTKGKFSLNLFNEHFQEEVMYSKYISMFKSL